MSGITRKRKSTARTNTDGKKEAKIQKKQKVDHAATSPSGLKEMIELSIENATITRSPVHKNPLTPHGLFDAVFDKTITEYSHINTQNVTEWMDVLMQTESLKKKIGATTTKSNSPLMLGHLMLSFRLGIDKAMLKRHLNPKSHKLCTTTESTRVNSSSRRWFEIIATEAISSAHKPSDAKNIPDDIFDDIRDFYLVLRQFNEMFFSSSCVNNTNRAITKAFATLLGFQVELPFYPRLGFPDTHHNDLNQKATVADFLNKYNSLHSRDVDPINFARSDKLRKAANEKFVQKVYQPHLEKVRVSKIKKELQSTSHKLEAATGLRLHDFVTGVVILPPLFEHAAYKFQNKLQFCTIGSSKKGESADQKNDIHEFKRKIMKYNREGTLDKKKDELKADIENLKKRHPNIKITENRPFYFYKNLSELLQDVNTYTNESRHSKQEYGKVSLKHRSNFKGKNTHTLRKFYACRVVWENENYKKFHPIVLINFLLSHDQSISISTSSLYFKYFVEDA